jgi:alkyl hydroperoxide reductase subunit AhpF
MTKLLTDGIEKQIGELFARLKEPVHIILFASQQNSEDSREARQLAEEVVVLSDKLSLENRDIHADAALADQYHVTQAPAMVIAAMDGEVVTDRGIRMLGIPSGHDFSAFIHDLLLVSSRDSGLTADTREYLKTIEKPVHLQVFVTPT